MDSQDQYTMPAIAPSTKKAYEKAWQNFQAWCVSNNSTFLPADEKTVEMYLVDQARAGFKVSSLSLRAVAINRYHYAAGYNSPVGHKVSHYHQAAGPVSHIQTKKIQIGARYGSFTIVGESIGTQRSYVFPCKCDCGNVINVSYWRLVRTGHCGCRAKNGQQRRAKKGQQRASPYGARGRKRTMMICRHCGERMNLTLYSRHVKKCCKKPPPMATAPVRDVQPRP